jgi:hypothetical protein
MTTAVINLRSVHGFNLYQRFLKIKLNDLSEAEKGTVCNIDVANNGSHYAYTKFPPV